MLKNLLDIYLEELVNDFETAHSDGEKLVISFFSERMFSSTKSFDATISRNARQTFAKMSSGKIIPNSKTLKSAAMESKAMADVVSTERASTLNSVSFQKTAMGLTALLLSSGKSTETTTREQRAEIHERIKHARVFDHLPTNTLIGYFEESLNNAEHHVCMYAWDNTLNQIKRNTTKQYETDIALQVAMKLVGGKDVSTINQERLSCIVKTLGLEKSKYCR
jgi:hypothetical protein